MKMESGDIKKRAEIVNNIIAERILKARICENVTQREIGLALGRTSASISDIERGKTKVKASDLLIIAERLDRGINYFYGGMGEYKIEFVGLSIADEKILMLFQRLKNANIEVLAIKQLGVLVEYIEDERNDNV